MVRPQELLDAVLYTLKEESDVPDSANFIGYTPDIDSEPINLPLVEVSPGPQSHISEMNTDFVGMKTDADGNEVGRIYESLYSLELTVAVWTVQESRFSPRSIMNTVRDALYAHDTGGPARPLRNPDGSQVDEVWRFALQEGEQTDDLTTSPTLRRTQQRVTISASERYVTDEEDPIKEVTEVAFPQ